MLPLKTDLFLNNIFKYHWEYHWKMFCYWMVEWNWLVFSNVIESTTEVWFIIEQYVPIPLRVPLKPDVITEGYWIVFSCTIESTTENNGLPLNGPVVQNGILNYRCESYWNIIEWSNDTKWYWTVFNAFHWYTIGSFCKGYTYIRTYIYISDICWHKETNIRIL